MHDTKSEVYNFNFTMWGIPSIDYGSTIEIRFVLAWSFSWILKLYTPPTVIEHNDSWRQICDIKCEGSELVTSVIQVTDWRHEFLLLRDQGAGLPTKGEEEGA